MSDGRGYKYSVFWDKFVELATCEIVVLIFRITAQWLCVISGFKISKKDKGGFCSSRFWPKFQGSLVWCPVHIRVDLDLDLDPDKSQSGSRSAEIDKILIKFGWVLNQRLLNEDQEQFLDACARVQIVKHQTHFRFPDCLWLDRPLQEIFGTKKGNRFPIPPFLFTTGFHEAPFYQTFDPIWDLLTRETNPPPN